MVVCLGLHYSDAICAVHSYGRRLLQYCTHAFLKSARRYSIWWSSLRRKRNVKLKKRLKWYRPRIARIVWYSLINTRSIKYKYWLLILLAMDHVPIQYTSKRIRYVAWIFPFVCRAFWIRWKWYSLKVLIFLKYFCTALVRQSLSIFCILLF